MHNPMLQKYNRYMRILSGLQAGDMLQLVSGMPRWMGHGIVLAPLDTRCERYASLLVLLGDRHVKLRLYKASMTLMVGEEQPNDWGQTEWFNVTLGRVHRVCNALQE